MGESKEKKREEDEDKLKTCSTTCSIAFKGSDLCVCKIQTKIKSQIHNKASEAVEFQLAADGA